MNPVPRLSEEQRKIVEAPVGNALVLAVPGSGKTTTLIHRIAHLVRLGFNPHDFFVVTFTNNAANEIKHRLSLLFDEIYNFKCGTFHSLAKHVLDQHHLVSQDIYHVDEFQFLFSDFLKTGSSERFRQQVKHIFVDEFQDVSPIQNESLKLLYSSATSITVVGDDHQNIYDFRGSDIRFIENFGRNFNPVSTYYLSTNYRSTQSIVTLSNLVTPTSLLFKPKALAFIQGGVLPRVCYHSNVFKGIEWVCEDIFTHHRSHLGKVAIISRSNYLLHYAEYLMCQRRVPTVYLSGQDDPNPGLGNNHSLTLSTVHGSKALEWESVYILGLKDNFFPDSRAINIESERRLFYVAVTRAKTQLTLMACSLTPSRFLDNVNSEVYNTIFGSPPASQLVEKSMPILNINAIEVGTLINQLNGNDITFLKSLLPNGYIESLLPLSQALNPFQEGFLDFGPPQLPEFVQHSKLFFEFGIFLELLARKILFDLQRKPFQDTYIYSCLYGKKSPLKLNFIIRQNLRKMYKSAQTTQWKDSLLDIWHLALCYSLKSGRKRILLQKVSKENLLEGCPMYDFLEKCLQTWGLKLDPKCQISLCQADCKDLRKVSLGNFNRYSKLDVSRNTLGNRKRPPITNWVLKGEIPFFSPSAGAVIDLKCGTSPSVLLDFYQTLVYVAVMKLQSVKVRSVSILNVPLRQLVTVDVSDWEHHKHFLKNILVRTSLYREH